MEHFGRPVRLCNNWLGQICIEVVIEHTIEVEMTGLFFGLGKKLLSPKPRKTQKYSAQGGFSIKSFEKYKLPPSIVTTLINAANHSLALGTWKSYKTAEQHILRLEKDTGVKMRMPFGTKETLVYIGWLKDARKVAAATIEKYLSGIRMLHLKQGYNVPALRPDIVKTVLVGLEQQENVEKRLGGKTERLAVTTSVLKLIKHELQKKDNWAIARKRLVWSVCLNAFHGSFRVHEILARDGMEFDLSSTLLGKDIKVENWLENEKQIKVLKVWLKTPKEQRKGQGVMVEIFETKSELCPVAAFEKWRKVSKVAMTKTKPAFRLEYGSLYTGKAFNADLKALLSKHIDYNKKKILSHSFRAGLATVMAQNGYSDSDIMRIGRWNSSAFLCYVKLNRVKRMKISREITKRLEL